jgi:hypothetical protein
MEREGHWRQGGLYNLGCESRSRLVKARSQSLSADGCSRVNRRLTNETKHLSGEETGDPNAAVKLQQ